LRRVWDQILAAVRGRRRSAEALLNADGHILDVRGNEIVIGFDNPNLARTFREGFNAEPLAEAVGDVIGGKWRVTITTGAGAGSTGSGGPSAGSGGVQRAGFSAPLEQKPPAPASTPGFAPGDEAMDDVPPDDDDPEAAGQRGPAVSGEDAAVALLQRGLGAKVIEEISPDS
jgi:DNA polymerase-3 subunit gamma/tau